MMHGSLRPYKVERPNDVGPGLQPPFVESITKRFGGHWPVQLEEKGAFSTGHVSLVVRKVLHFMMRGEHTYWYW
jgi:hypothetical protein